MFLWNRLICCQALLLSGLLLGGCSLSSDSQQDDEKEPHYLTGKGLVNAMDFAGAVEAFKESLEVDPHSAAAHYQLAWIYENKLTNAAAAIYHYQESLELNPKAPNHDIISQHIYACKEQLVADVMQMPTAPAVQLQIEKLSEKNRQMQDELDKWHAYYAAEMTARNNGLSSQAPSPNIPAGGQSAPATPLHQNGEPFPGGPASAPSAPIHLHTHVIVAGETLATIARKAHVSLAALENINPGLNPKRLRQGQTINLP